MKSSIRLFLCGGLLSMGIGIAIADTDLPKVEVLGKEYYYHEIKKGESIYGIAKQHDWDLNELIRLNPTAVSEMKKGTRLYYPTGRVTVVTDMPAEEPSEADSISVEPIMHHVKRGETVYSIARQYNIPVSQIYESCPNSKKGIKAGETLVIKQTPGSNAGSIIYYQIKPGDTLYSLARRYQTSVEEILKINPGISETNFRSGNTIKIAANSEGHKVRTELVDEERVASLESYKVGKNENWNDIARKTGVDVETLKDANEDVVKPKKNDVVNVPVVETVQVEKEYVEIDPREQTSEGIKELYDSIHGIDAQKAMENEVRVALVLDQPTAKKDIEFTRGFLTALDGMKREKFKIVFKVIDGRGASEKTTEILDAFKPNLIIATADKSFPVYLAEYGNANNVEVVNSFDLRNELCEENASMVQVLSPSSFFNQQMGEQLAEDYGNRQIVMVGSADKSDGIADAFLNNVESSGVQKVYVDKLYNYNFT
ncbi:MAG: LysM peptidoglycan-binding domain-containing protein, partial [Muribaculaceae bacterium]|nr:LysM peptidoglycan-binding domain-containing protein [Muribaculaceae bacterium]